MKKRLHTALAVSAVIILAMLTACNNESKNPSELKAADSLLVELNKADSLLFSLDAEEVEEHAEKIQAHQASYRVLIPSVGDTLDLPTSILLSDYEASYKVFEEYGESRKKLRPAIDSLRKSLNNLSHDLKENSLAEGLDPKKCVADEAKKVTGLSQYSGIIIPAVKNKMVAFDTLHPKIEAFISRMKEKQAAAAAPKK